MHRILSILIVFVALFALTSPSFATGVCVAHGGLAVVAGDDGSVPLPNPCEMQGGKRVMPSRSDLARFAAEVPRAMVAQWALGLADEPMHEGRAPAAELPPPRLG